MAGEAGGSGSMSKGDISLGLGVAALLTFVIAMFVTGDEGDENGWLWMVMAAFAAGALVVGLMAGGGKPKGRALIGTVIGALFVLLFLVFALGIVQ